MAFSKKEKMVFIHQAAKSSKGILVSKYFNCADQLDTWVEVAMNISSYLYMVMPFADIFTDKKTFAPKTLEQIKERAKANYNDFVFNRVIWVVNETGKNNPGGPKIDIISLSNEEEFTELLKFLNRARKKIIGETRESVDCGNCLFRESCADPTTKTGINVYGCMQFQPIKGFKNEHTNTKSIESKGRSDSESIK